MSRYTKKGPYGFSVCGSSNPHAQSPIWATDMRCLLEASSKSSLDLRIAKTLARLRLCAGLSETVLVAYVIRTLF